MSTVDNGELWTEFSKGALLYSRLTFFIEPLTVLSSWKRKWLKMLIYDHKLKVESKCVAGRSLSLKAKIYKRNMKWGIKCDPAGRKEIKKLQREIKLHQATLASYKKQIESLKADLNEKMPQYTPPSDGVIVVNEAADIAGIALYPTWAKEGGWKQVNLTGHYGYEAMDKEDLGFYEREFGLKILG